MKATWIAMLAIMLVSLAPIVLAEEDSGDMSKREKMKELRDEIKETRGVVKDVREMRKATREEMKARREELKALAETLKVCKGKRSEDCEQKRSEAKLAAKDVLSSAADDAIALLQAAKDRISSSDLANKDAIIAELDAQIAAMTEAKANSDALSETSTKEEVKDAAKDLRETMHKAKNSLRKGAHGLVAKRLGGVLQKAEHLETRLEKALAKLASKGVDTSNVDLTAFKSRLDEASKFHAEAIAAFEKAKDAEAGMKDELMKEATDKLRAAHRALKEAHAMLRGIVQGLKGLKGGSEALTEASEESEAEESTTEAAEEAPEADDADEADEDDADEADEDEADEDESASTESNANTENTAVNATA